MKLLLVHNHYQQSGGEDRVFAAEADLLQSRGHLVERYTTHNDRITGMGRLSLARRTIWNDQVYSELQTVVRRVRPDIVHVHNTLPLLSPAVFYAAKSQGLAVVLTLHNYRLLCPNALFFRDGHVCEDCLGSAGPLPGVVHACYRNSHAASGIVATMLVAHRLLRTWTRTVDVFIALTEFARQKFIAGGLQKDRIVVKPNFVPDPGARATGGSGALFVGRLSTEKGLDVLLSAWKYLGGSIPLKIIGDGPLRQKVVAAAQEMPELEWLGAQTADQVLCAMKGARCLIVPSLWYETFGLVVAEAYAVGLPVIASRVGALGAMVQDGRTGLHFEPGNSRDLGEKVHWAMQNPTACAEMGARARAHFESEFTGEKNYEMLMAIYRSALEHSHLQQRQRRS